MSSQAQRGWETVPELDPELTDELVFIRGAINNRCSIQKISDLNPSIHTNLIYVSNNGVDSPSYNGSSAKPYQTYEYARAQCKLLNPNYNNQFTIVFDSGEYSIVNFTISPYISLDMNGGRLIFQNVVVDPDWSTEIQGIFNFYNAEIGMIEPGLMAAPIFNFDIQFSDNPYFINFDNIKIINTFNWDIKLSDKTTFLFNNIYDKNSFGSGTLSLVNIDGGNFYISNSRIFNLFYTKANGIEDTQFGIFNSLCTIDVNNLVTPSVTQLAMFNSFIINSNLNNSNDNLQLVYDAISFRTPTVTGTYPPSFGITQPQSINTGTSRTNYTPVPDPLSGAINIESELEGIDNKFSSISPGGGDVSWIGGVSVANNVATYSDTTGKIIKDSGLTAADVGQILVLTSSGKDLILLAAGQAFLQNTTGDAGIDSVNSISFSTDNGGTVKVGSDTPTATIESILQALNIHGGTGVVVSAGAGGTVFLDSPDDIVASSDTGVFRLTTPLATAKISAPGGNLSVSAANDLFLDYGGDLYFNGVKFGSRTSIPTAWTGIWALPLGFNILYSKIGDQVFIDVPEGVLDAASIASFIQCSPALPVGLRPAFTKYFPILIQDNNIKSISTMVIETSGLIKIYGNANLGNFSGSATLGSSGFFSTSVRYFV